MNIRPDKEPSNRILGAELLVVGIVVGISFHRLFPATSVRMGVYIGIAAATVFLGLFQASKMLRLVWTAFVAPLVGYFAYLITYYFIPIPEAGIVAALVVAGAVVEANHDGDSIEIILKATLRFVRKPKVLPWLAVILISVFCIVHWSIHPPLNDTSTSAVADSHGTEQSLNSTPSLETVRTGETSTESPTQIRQEDNIISPEEVAAMRRTFREYQGPLKSYYDRTDANERRQKEIEYLKVQVIALDDTNLSKAWSDVKAFHPNDEGLFINDGLTPLINPNDHFLSGNITKADEEEFDLAVKQFGNLSKRAKEQRDSQMRFVELTKIYPSLNGQISSEMTTDDVRHALWDNHTLKYSDVVNDRDRP